MRKRIYLLLMALLVAVSLCACGNGDDLVHSGNSGAEEAAQTEQADLASEEAAQTEQAELGKPDAKEQDNQEASGLKPAEPQDSKENQKKVHRCTVSIVCTTILEHTDDLDESKREVLPEDGIILPAEEVEFSEGESVFDILLRITQENKIHMEFVQTPLYKSSYVEGIQNIYEFDCGELSGWMYRINGQFPNYGCSRHLLKDGDQIEWVYTCDLGEDVGGDWNAQNSREEEQ